MNEPLVSVIVPTFQRASLLPEALASALAQTYPRFEIVVVDDGSTDGTAEYLDRLEDPRVTVLRQENRGVSAARNAAIKAARGELLALLDSDDLWLPDKLARQVAHMGEGGLDICQTNETWERGGKKVKQPKSYAKPEGWFFERALEMCLISPSCTMFSRPLWERVGPFDEEFPAFEDYDLWLRVCLRYPVGLVEEALTVKRGGRDDHLSTGVPFPDIYRIRAMIKILDDPRLSPDQREAAHREIGRKARIYCEGCAKRGRDAEGERFWNLICKALEGKNVPLNQLIA